MALKILSAIVFQILLLQVQIYKRHLLKMHHLLPRYSVKILITHPALRSLVLTPGFLNVLL